MKIDWFLSWGYSQTKWNEHEHGKFEETSVNEAQAVVGSSQFIYAFIAFASDIIRCQWHSSEMTGIYLYAVTLIWFASYQCFW